MPGAGGEYVYLTEAYGPLYGFIYSWTQMWVAKSGSIATLATAFFEYTAHFVPAFEKVWFGVGPLHIKYGQIFAMGLILSLGLVNYFGVKIGGAVQIAVTAVKVGLIAFVIIAGLIYSGGAPASAPVPASPLATGFVAALVAALWAYDGWNNVGMVASEVKNPRKNLPLALIGGTVAVIAIYLLANWAYFRVLSPAEVGAHKLVAAEMMARVQGPEGAAAVSDSSHDLDLRRAERFDPDRIARSLRGGARRAVFPVGCARSSRIPHSRNFHPDDVSLVLLISGIRKIRRSFLT